MPIISKETWDKFTQEEKEKIRKEYSYLIKAKDCDEERRDCHIGALVNMDDLFGKENLQPQPLTYENVARELFKDGAWQPDEDEIVGIPVYNDIVVPKCWLNFTSQKQVEKLLAINKLLNVAKFLNGDWKPDWECTDEEKYYIIIDNYSLSKEIAIRNCLTAQGQITYFRTEELAKQAIRILGEDTIRLALSSDY